MNKSLKILKFLGVCFLVLFPQIVNAQSKKITVNGIVFSSNNQPINRANITAEQNGIVKDFSISTNTGSFKLQLNYGDQYKITASCVGYIANGFSSQFFSDTTIKIILHDKLYQEDSISVSAKRSIYEKGDTIFHNADAFRTGNEENLSELVKNIPGFSVLPNGTMLYNGQIVKKVLLEGNDLTSDSYEKIVNNFSPHNIQQIQLLKKYNDPFKIGNEAGNTTEIAVNIKFKNKRLIPSAKIAASIGMPLNYFEQKGDILLLGKKISSLSLFNYNTIGNTKTSLLPNTQLGEERQVLFLQNEDFQNKIIEKKLPIPSNLNNFNKSKYFSNNTQIRLASKLMFRVNIDYVAEKSNQKDESINVITFNSQQIVEAKNTGTQQLQKDELRITNELILAKKKSEQLGVKLDIAKNFGKGTAYNILNEKNITQFVNNNSLSIRSNINFQKFYRKGSILSTGISYNEIKHSEYFTNDSTIFNNAIISNSVGIPTSVMQNFNPQAKIIESFFTLTLRKHNHKISLNPNILSNQGQLNSNLKAKNNQLTDFLVIDSFKNNISFKHFFTKFAVNYKYEKNKLILLVQSVPTFFKVRDWRTENRFFVDNSLFIELKQNNKRHNSFHLINSNNNDFSQNFSNNTIVGFSQKIKATNFVPFEKKIQFNFNSFKSAIANKVPVLSYSFSFQQSHKNYYRNLVYTNFYSEAINEQLSNNTYNLITSIRAEQTIKILRLRHIQSISYLTGSYNYGQNNILINAKYRTFQHSISLRPSKVQKINYKIVHSIAFSQNSFSLGKNEVYSNLLELEINTTLGKRRFLNANLLHYSILNRSRNYFSQLGLVYSEYIPKLKLKMSFELRNITKETKFEAIYQSSTQNLSVHTFILPRFILFRFNFLL